MVYEDENQNGFFGKGSRTISEATQQQVDEEVRRILMNNIKLLVISWKIIKISHMRW
jgi:cell division protease FtsH